MSETRKLVLTRGLIRIVIIGPSNTQKKKKKKKKTFKKLLDAKLFLFFFKAPFMGTASSIQLIP